MLIIRHHQPQWVLNCDRARCFVSTTDGLLWSPQHLELMYLSQKIALGVVMHALSSNCLGERMGLMGSRYTTFLLFFLFFPRQFFPISLQRSLPPWSLLVYNSFSKSQWDNQDRRPQRSSWEGAKGRLTRPLGYYSETHLSNTVFQGREGWERLWLLSLQINLLKHIPSRMNKVPKQFIWDMHCLSSFSIF